MGADLYVMDKDGNEIAYFRDSYNSSNNLLWRFGGNYWGMSELKTDKQKLEYLKKCINKGFKKDEKFNKFKFEGISKEEEKEIVLKELKELQRWIRIAESTINNGGNIIWSV